jgi:hypothetical protein
MKERAGVFYVRQTGRISECFGAVTPAEAALASAQGNHSRIESRLNVHSYLSAVAASGESRHGLHIPRHRTEDEAVMTLHLY